MNNCIICFKNKNDMIELTCNHEFCFKCLKKGVSTYNLKKCPLCRQKIINSDIDYIMNYIKKNNIIKKNYITRNKSYKHRSTDIKNKLRNLALQFNWNDMNKNNRLSYNIRILDDMCQLIFKNVWYIKREINLEGKENEDDEHYIYSIIRCIKGFTNLHEWANGKVWLYKFKELNIT